MHDEVILEVPEMSIQPVAGIVRNQMESAMQLSVKLPVKLKVGPTWGDLADYS